MPQELQAARLRLVKKRPYLAFAAWALQPVEKPGLETLAVDQWWRLYYDPAVILRWSVEELTGVLYHEISHLLRDHALRMRDLEPQLSNLCSDAEINDNLLAEGERLPGNPVTPASIGQPNGLLAEEYYAALQAQQFVIQQNTLAESQAPAPGAGRCGSCATGHQETWEEGPPGEDASPGISQAEGDLIRRDVARQIKEHARACGTVPGYWILWAEEKLRPKVDWRKELASAVRHAVADIAGASDYSYRRPSRRQGQIGNGKVVFPSLRRPVPNVAVLVDTSGSINKTMLAQALAEISGILQSLSQREGVQVLACDAQVQACRKVFCPEQVQLVGGGGTDMGIGLSAAEKIRPKPQVCIVITDGWTPWPDRSPQGIKIIVVLVGDGEAPEWAKTIKIRTSS